MAVSKNGVTQVCNRDTRFIESCLGLMFAKGLIVSPVVQNASESTEIINQTIADWRESSEKKEHFVIWMLNEAKQRLLPLQELDWIKGNDRACYWFWLSLLKSNFFAHPSYPILLVPNSNEFQLARSYKQLNLNLMPSSTKERFGEIVKFLDRGAQPLEWQRNLISFYKPLWGFIYTARKPLTWLKRSEEDQCRWAWEYLKKASHELNNPILQDINPVGLGELYLAIYAVFDTWAGTNDSKRLLLNDFNKAWQQKKHRDNRQGKKACNLVLREEVKRKLDEMAGKRGMKLNQLVEELIEEGYDRMDNL
ncbi:hypothetical protein [Shewanella algae]|uniref:hypothetical protein n=1 Tax=Shewanella algae TaxID=38313 RepID=UPI001AAF8F79|nr:hypothetical protein [Shewanella algae]MBO2583551.1 hypothetical protein [Shewanella algae]